jgi:hypothetical protein
MAEHFLKDSEMFRIWMLAEHCLNLAEFLFKCSENFHYNLLSLNQSEFLLKYWFTIIWSLNLAEFLGQWSSSRLQGETRYSLLSQWIYMWNMKALSVMVQKLWPRLKFSKCRSKVTVKGSKYDTDEKVLSQGIHMWNIKAKPLMVQKLWPRLKFSKCRSKVTVKGQKV